MINGNNRYVRLFVLWLGGIAVLMIPLYYINQAIEAPWAGVIGFAALVSGLAVNWISWRIF